VREGGRGAVRPVRREMMEAEVGATCFEDGEKAKKCSQPPEVRKKQESRFSSRCITALQTHFRLLSSRTSE
jgi:hypothetical protein